MIKAEKTKCQNVGGHKRGSKITLFQETNKKVIKIDTKCQEILSPISEVLFHCFITFNY